MQTPILGSSYVARSVNAADSRMVNLFPEVVPDGGLEPAFLQRCPGLKFQQTVGAGPVRGLFAPSSVALFYAVIGSTMYSFSALTATPVSLGTVTGTGPVSIADNGYQLFIAAGATGYIYNYTTAVFAQITDPDFPGATDVTYLDGYFVFNQPNSQKIWVTSLLDGTSIDPLEFASAEGAPDLVVGLISDHRELVVLGSGSMEVWYDAGALDFPLVRQQGTFSEVGCAAAKSISRMDNQIYWLGQDERGTGIVYAMSGYVPARISTHAVEWQIQQYADISDATSYTYQQDGHQFYVLNFPSADTTWVFDVATGVWHERAEFSNGAFARHRANNKCVFANEVVVGDFENGNIYTLDLDIYADNGATQKWLRSWRALPTGENDFNRTAQHALQLNCEAGVGLNAGQGSDPQAMLRWSDDGGHTWSNEHWRSMGVIGKYGFRTIWRRLGMTTKLRDRVYEVSGTDPVKIAIMGAELHINKTGA
tara:strand:+ start:6182 stop:7621 length:1440 start_codon:yes stop_codon:yes gene_type:complete